MTRHRNLRHVVAICLLSVFIIGTRVPQLIQKRPQSFDHTYTAYGELLHRYIAGTRVNYTHLTRDRVALDAVAADIGIVSEDEFKSWTREEQIAYWINAYNIFTLQAIVNHYPIRRRWFSWLTFSPHNSIKQIPGVWTGLQWHGAGHELTLDEIEHGILRKKYDEPRIHFAVNCAAISCPPLRAEPYIGIQLDEQLSQAARDFLNSDLGLQIDGSTLLVSKIFDWYGEDFFSNYAESIDTKYSSLEQAILGFVAAYGPLEAVRLIQDEMARIKFLKYNWALNDNSPD